MDERRSLHEKGIAVMSALVVALGLIVALLSLVLPVDSAAAGKPHVKTENQECEECHSSQEKVWLGGKHGLMGVKCVVCHGSPEQNFVPKPGVDRCRGCHEAEVSTVTMLPAKDQACFLCHDHHTDALKESAKNKAGFHRRGGAK
jgi:hypothetical protein